MATRIKKLKVECLRGIRNSEIVLDGKSLLVIGENGTGKSSFVDALEYFFTGQISHLERVQGLSFAKHAPHVLCDVASVSVEACFDPGGVPLVRSPVSEPSPPHALQAYFATTQQGVFILRRSQLLRFIASQPADRFRAIGSIIGIEELDRTELELKRLRDDLKAELGTQEQDEKSLFDKLTHATGVTIASQDGIVPALNEFLRKRGLDAVESVKDSDKLSERLLKDVKQTPEIAEARALSDLKDNDQAMASAQELLDGIDELDAMLSGLQSQGAVTQLVTLGLLRAGQETIDAQRLDFCPLCEQSIDRNRTLSAISGRIQTLIALSDEAESVRLIAKTLAREAESLSSALSNMTENLAMIPSMRDYGREVSSIMIMSTRLGEALTAAGDLTLRIRCEQVRATLESLMDLSKRVAAVAIDLSEKSSLSKEELRVLETDRVLQSVKEHSEALDLARPILNSISMQYDISEEIYSVFSTTKRNQIQAVYDSIQSDIECYYSHLHPGEPHQNIELKVVQGRRASTALTLESFGQSGQDPRALCSEGHLDSLGLCIFLAFVKKFNEDCPLMVLDDIVTTIDASHREKICTLLLQNFSDRQMVVTTHDEVWYQSLIDSQRLFKLAAKFVNLRITAWDLQAGPVLVPFRTKWEEIQKKLTDGDKKGAGNAGRQYLEWVLFEICITTRAQLPIPLNRKGRYEVGDLFQVARARLNKLATDGAFLVSLKQCFDNLDAALSKGNILSHEGELGSQYSTSEAQSFCEAVHNLHVAFCCTECGCLLAYNGEARRLECRSPKCQTPLFVKTE